MALNGDIERQISDEFSLLFPHLDERRRRLLMGARAETLGRGGISRVARLAGVHPSTVSKGLLELGTGTQPSERARRPGAGRKRLTVSDPGLMNALLALIKPGEQPGGPTPPLQWTTMSTRRLASELTRQGHRISAWSVTNLLSEAGFSLQASPGNLSAAQLSSHDAQFAYINEQATAHLAVSQPVIVVGLRKRELRGDVPAARAQQTLSAGEQAQASASQRVRASTSLLPTGDGRPAALPQAAAPPGDWVVVRPDRDTMSFALVTIRTWWGQARKSLHHGAKRLLLIAERGASTGVADHSFGSELSKFAVEARLGITVCGLPAGTVKWNSIEDRISSELSIRRPDAPPTRNEVNLNLIVNTTVRRPDSDASLAGGESADGVLDGHADAWNYAVGPAPALLALQLPRQAHVPDQPAFVRSHHARP
jgi:hypothetical protein